MTKQSFADEADVNVIMKRYERTGMLDQVERRTAIFGDFTGVEDYHTALNRVLDAQEAFDALPADVREHFRNDPAELVAAWDDAERAEELRKLGIRAEVPAEGGKPAGGDQADAGGAPGGVPEGSAQ